MATFQEKKRIGFGEFRRKMIIDHATKVVKERTPIHIEKLLSWLELEIGLARKNAQSILIVLHDTEIISIDNDTGMVYWGKKSKIGQEKEENIPIK